MITTRRTRLLASTLLLAAVAAVALAQARPKPRNGVDQPAPADPAPVREVVKVINAPGTYQFMFTPMGNNGGGYLRFDTRTGDVDEMVQDANTRKVIWVPLR